MASKVTRRQFLAVAGTALVGVAAAACGGTPVAPTATPVPASKPAAPTTVPTAASASPSGTFVFASPNEAETRRPVVEKFFKDNYPNITPQCEVTASNYWEKILAGIAAKSVADGIYMHESRVFSFADQNALMTLDDYMTKQPLIGDPSAYPMNIFKPSVTWKSKMYALPVGFAVLMLRYNKTAFDKAGIAAPSDKWTWDDMRMAAAKMTKNVKADGSADQWGWTGWNPGWRPADWALLQSYGATNFNDAADTCIINNDAGVQAFDFMRGFWVGDLRSSPSPAVLTQLGSGGQKVFEGGLSVMDYILAANVASSLTVINSKFEMGLELYPSGPKGKFLRAGGTSYAIPVGSKHPDLAWALFRYEVGDEEANRIAASYDAGNPCLRLDYMLKYNTPTGPLADTFKRIVSDGFNKYGTVIRYSVLGDYDTIVGSNCDHMASGEWTAKQTVDAIAAAANKELKGA